jgi:hypothetical protein
VTRRGASAGSLTLRLGEATLVGLIALAFVAIAELAAFAWLSFLKPDQPGAVMALSDEELIDLYDGADPEQSRSVLAEGWGIGYSDEYQPFSEFRMRAVSGQYVNIHAEGYRLNSADVAEIGDAMHSIFVFGGSTTLGMGVADHQTIPAALERRLQRDFGPEIAVYNFGVSGFFSTQERILFEQLLARGYVPDAAVFIDGLNDFYFADVPDRSSWSDRIDTALAAYRGAALLRSLARKSQVVRLTGVLSGRDSVRSSTGFFARTTEEIDRVIRRLDTNRRMIRGICRELGIKPVLVQQPVPTYHYDNNDRPVQFPRAQLVYHANSELGYPRMETLRAEGHLLDADVLWLAELEIDANLYIDTVHYSPAFGDAIAAEIYAALVSDQAFVRRLRAVALPNALPSS